jgi:hypothetical protein
VRSRPAYYFIIDYFFDYQKCGYYSSYCGNRVTLIIYLIIATKKEKKQINIYSLDGSYYNTSEKATHVGHITYLDQVF